MDPRKKLFQLTVSDLTGNHGVVTLDHYLTMAEAAAILDEHDITGAPVVDEVGKCIGFLSSRDFVSYENARHREQAHSGSTRTFDMLDRPSSQGPHVVENPFDRVYRHMSTAVQTVDPCTKLVHASEIMCAEHIHHLVLLDENERPAGVITSMDVVASLWNLKIFSELTED